MKEKKYIDRLYQEKFKDFEAVPNDAVWDSISSKLQKKNKKPVLVPLWQKIAGVAALFVFFLLIGDWFSPQQAPLVNEENAVGDPAVNEIIPSEETSVATTPEAENEDKDENTLGIPDNNREQTALLTSEGKTKEVAEISSLTASNYKSQNQYFETETIILIETDDKKRLAKIGLIEKKSIFDEILEMQQEPETEEKITESALEITTYAAPVFYGNLGEGSFLDPQFNDNSSEGEITYSYGIQVALAISKNLKIRSGINKVNMSYTTQGIAYQAVTRPMAISAVSYSKNSYPTTNLGAARSANRTYRMSLGSINGALLNQELGYLEVPVELEYNVIDKKFELNVIGGASTLFLNENMVTVSTGNITTELGKANNLNTVSFSTNVGLGLDYNLSKSFKLNLEPMFKYQINAFNTESVQYQPFYLAIYTGLSFEF